MNVTDGGWYRVDSWSSEDRAREVASSRVLDAYLDTIEGDYEFTIVEEDEGKWWAVYARPLQDSSSRPNRVAFTGSVRDNREGKGRYDLESPITRRRLVEALEKGADKYDTRNWELGQPLSWYYDSASRHLTNWWADGETKDLVSAFVNLHMAVHTDEMIRRGVLPEKLNDRPDYTGGPDEETHAD